MPWDGAWQRSASPCRWKTVGSRDSPQPATLASGVSSPYRPLSNLLQHDHRAREGQHEEPDVEPDGGGLEEPVPERGVVDREDERDLRGDAEQDQPVARETLAQEGGPLA